MRAQTMRRCHRSLPAVAALTLIGAFALALPAACASGEAGAKDEPGTGSTDWPQWRGVNRDAVSPETGLLDRWPEGGPEIVWRSTAGAGFSSVAVVDGRLYTLGDLGDGQFLLCLDARSGEELWRRELGAKFEHAYGDGPRSTPVVDGDLVFAVGTGGRLMAATRTGGEVVWQQDLVAEFGSELPSYGFSSSPLIVGDKLLLEVGGKSGTFMAFRKKSGKVVWATQADQPAYSSPIAITIDGTEQVVFWSARGLHAVSPSDGSLLWKYGSETFCSVTGDPLNTGTPIFLAPDRIFIASGSGATLLRVERDGEAFRVEEVWETERMRSDVNSAVRVGDFIYGFNRGILTCLDAGTGEVEWKTRGFDRGSLIAADGKLIVLGEKGNLALVDATPDAFVQRAVATVLRGRNWTSPSLAGGKLYLRNHEQLLCIDLRP